MKIVEKYYNPIKSRIYNPANETNRDALKQRQITYCDILENNIPCDSNKETRELEILQDTLIISIRDLQLWTNRMDKAILKDEIIEPPEGWNETDLLFLSEPANEYQYKKYALYNVYERFCNELFQNTTEIMDKLGWL